MPKNMQRYGGADSGEQMYLASVAELLLGCSGRRWLYEFAKARAKCWPSPDVNSMRKDSSASKIFSLLRASIAVLSSESKATIPPHNVTNFFSRPSSFALRKAQHNTWL